MIVMVALELPWMYPNDLGNMFQEGLLGDLGCLYMFKKHVI